MKSHRCDTVKFPWKPQSSLIPIEILCLFRNFIFTILADSNLRLSHKVLLVYYKNNIKLLTSPVIEPPKIRSVSADYWIVWALDFFMNEVFYLLLTKFAITHIEPSFLTPRHDNEMWAKFLHTSFYWLSFNCFFCTLFPFSNETFFQFHTDPSVRLC